MPNRKPPILLSESRSQLRVATTLCPYIQLLPHPRLAAGGRCRGPLRRTGLDLRGLADYTRSARPSPLEGGGPPTLRAGARPAACPNRRSCL